MKKPKINPKFAVKHAGRVIGQNSPTLLSAVAVVGVAGTAYLTLKATWKAKDEVLAAEVQEGHVLTSQEVALKVWKLYIPAVGVGAATIGCIVASNRIAVRRLAAMAAAYGVLSGDFDEYRSKALEMLGEKKEKTIHDKAVEEKMKTIPTPIGPSYDDGKAWFVDMSTKRPFRATRGEVDKACNDLNYQMMHGGCTYATLNEAYSYLGLDTTNIGDQLGWTSEQQVEFRVTPVFMDDGNTATGVVMTPEPSPDFDGLH